MSLEQAESQWNHRLFSFTKFPLTCATAIATVEVVVGGSVKGPQRVKIV